MTLRYNLQVALDEAAGVVLNDRGAREKCPPLSWSYPPQHSGRNEPMAGLAYEGMFAPGEAVMVVHEWAVAFDLEPSDEATEGTVSYRGLIDGVHVEVWAIVDRHAFEHVVTEATSAARERRIAT